MKKSILALLGATLFSGTALANSVSCYVDTDAYDQFSKGNCQGAEYRPYPRQGAVVFKLDAAKPVQSVTWSIPGYSSSCSGTTCIVRVGLGEHSVNACVDKVYYKDYTWADVNWCAGGFATYWDGNGPLDTNPQEQ
ncbi:hypothetical protein CWB96_08900 [Pseudoalteromonas citrea]|uniref:Uncharacterized protein n=1 Tax=Pseudoalteromonas citrea TaxID=43655 RepID=A0A5S3XSF3_9GAMM|nr:hypothetical protein [Pseudoalteromonas citrea]TMP40833.1 hypothetical protein CWB97_16640 [Pseudoalteromonas citrea]TMP59697.1 hypothetical protein CWB96_08900 [Pseudoalteromonas citrea]